MKSAKTADQQPRSGQVPNSTVQKKNSSPMKARQEKDDAKDARQAPGRQRQRSLGQKPASEIPPFNTSSPTPPRSKQQSDGNVLSPKVLNSKRQDRVPQFSPDRRRRRGNWPRLGPNAPSEPNYQDLGLVRQNNAEQQASKQPDYEKTRFDTQPSRWAAINQSETAPQENELLRSTEQQPVEYDGGESESYNGKINRKSEHMHPDDQTSAEDEEELARSESSGEAKYEINPKLLDSKQIVADLIHNVNINPGKGDRSGGPGMLPIVSAVLTSDKRSIVTIEQESGDLAYVRAYILDSSSRESADDAWHEKEGTQHLKTPKKPDIDDTVQNQTSVHDGCKGWVWESEFSYPDGDLKLDAIEQNEDSSNFVIPYQNGGHFYMRILDGAGGLVDNVDLNDLCKFQAESTGVNERTAPLVTCCLNSTRNQTTTVFVNLFHNSERCQYHFRYDISEKKLGVGGVVKVSFQPRFCTQRNYPVQTVFSSICNKYFSFYRQGMYIEVNHFDVSQYDEVKLVPKEMCQVIYVKGVAIVSASDQIFFYQLIESEGSKKCYFKKYDRLEVRGSITYTPGGGRFQIVTQKQIYVYALQQNDDETITPQLESAIYNYMKCSNVLFTQGGMFAVSYTAGQRGLNVYQKKFHNSFKVLIDPTQSYEGASTLLLGSWEKQAYLISFGREVQVIDAASRKCRQKLVLDNTGGLRGAEAVLHMAVSRDEKRLAIGMGEARQHGVPESVSCLVIFEKNPNNRTFKEVSRRAVKFEEHTTIKFVFDERPGNTHHLIFADSAGLFRFDYQNPPDGQSLAKYFNEAVMSKKKEIESKQLSNNAVNVSQGSHSDQQADIVDAVYTFRVELKTQPDFVSYNADQTAAIVAGSEKQIKFVKIKEGSATNDGNDDKGDDDAEIDLYEHEHRLEDVQAVCSDDDTFYILTNKRNQKLGTFLIGINQNDPAQVHVHLNWEHRCTIGDANLAVMRNRGGCHEGSPHLVISYQQQQGNTYNIFVLDVGTDKLDVWHESYSLWESEVSGFCLGNDDFLLLSKEGMHLIALSAADDLAARTVRTVDNQKHKLHSIGSMRYLALQGQNHIKVDCRDEETVICVQDHQAALGEELQFMELYKITLSSLSLREAMIIQSIFGAVNEKEMAEFVQAQPSPSLFLQNYLELGKRSVITYLVFAQEAVAYLLDPQLHGQHFSKEHPLFYQSRDGKSIIDQALDYNMVRPLTKIIQHIVTYQDKFVFASLFRGNLRELMRRSIPVSPILNSQIFLMPIEYDQWPRYARDCQKLYKAYNGSPLQMAGLYTEMFPNSKALVAEEGERIGDDYVRQEGGGTKAQISNASAAKKREYKIKYTLNFLPGLALNQEHHLVDALAQTDELAVFKSQAVIDFAAFHWNAYAWKPLYLCFIFHCFYVGCLMCFIDRRCSQGHSIDDTRIYLTLMCLGIVMAFVYDTLQLFRNPTAYFTDLSNICDQLHIWLGVVNIVVQHSEAWHGEPLAGALLILVVALSLFKMFFYVRIFRPLQVAVTILRTALRDCLPFAVLHIMMILTLYAIMATVEHYSAAGEWSHDDELADAAAPSGSAWVLPASVATVVFLPCFIAEARQTHEAVSKNIQEILERERVQMILEAQIVWGKSIRTNENWFSSYLVVREQDQ